LVSAFLQGSGQSLGGTTIFNFLKYSSAPQISALGGINVSQQTKDVSISLGNPALLGSTMHGQMAANFSSLKDGFKNYQLVGAFRHENLKTNFYGAVNFFDYGRLIQTDAAGNTLGEFRPNEYVIQVGASRAYGERLNYGATLKFAHSGYGNFKASGLAMDVGVSYKDTASLIQIGLVLSNMGIQTNSFQGAGRENLPFDIQLGISKRLEKAPFQFSLTLHHLHQFDIRYRDSSFDADNGFNQSRNDGIFDKLFRHCVLSTQLFISDKLEISAGYNYLRRKELNIGNNGNGLNGFSMGVGILVKKIQIRFARTFYQASFATNQFGLGLSLQ